MKQTKHIHNTKKTNMKEEVEMKKDFPTIWTEVHIKNVINQARKYAIARHEETNQKYGKEFPYSLHLFLVYTTALKFIHLIDDLNLKGDVLASCWTHDLIEDARQTYNDVRENTNVRIAEITYALTNEKGKNRAERGNDKYYEGIRETEGASFVKLCDRIANVEFSKQQGSSMFEKYKKENAGFQKKLYVSEEYNEMWKYLNDIFENGK